jgi:cytochrome bd-type quinol oxidase subunit 2
VSIRKRWGNVTGLLGDLHSLASVHVNFVLNGGRAPLSLAIYFVCAVGGGLSGIAVIAGAVWLAACLWAALPGWLRSVFQWAFIVLFWGFMILGIHTTAKEAHAEWRRTHPGPEPTLLQRVGRWARLWALCLLAAVALVAILVTLGVQ